MGMLSGGCEACLGGQTLAERVAGAVAGLNVDVRIIADALDFAGVVTGHHVQGVGIVYEPDRGSDSGARLAIADEVDEFMRTE